MVHSHLLLSTNEHPCFLPAFPFGSRLAPSFSWWVVGWFFFFLTLYCICFLLVYKEQLACGGLHFLSSTCVVLFFTHCYYKSVHSSNINVVCPPCWHLSCFILYWNTDYMLKMSDSISWDDEDSFLFLTQCVTRTYTDLPIDSHHPYRHGEWCVPVITKGCSLCGGLLPTLDSQVAAEWSELTG